MTDSETVRKIQEGIGSIPVLLHGDSSEVLRSFPENSFDAIVTDPPYGLGKSPDPIEMLRDWIESGRHEVSGRGFMGKKWDAFVPGPHIWKECLRVLKPGGHLLAFGGTRTYDLLVLALRIAGFEIRDQIAWVRADGFPKSRNAFLATDNPSWKGWGTALKPAMEPIVVCRKPLSGSLGKNISSHGTGALNIDGCRVGKNGERDWIGRFPGNFVHDGSPEVLSLFPETKQGGSIRKRYSRKKGTCYGEYAPNNLFSSYRDSGSAARFFYCAKASRSDREEGLGQEQGMKPLLWSNGTKNPGSFQSSGTDRNVCNHHPTVKPTELMRWLTRLVTPPGGLVLDPFMGSGSTGKGALLEGFRFVGIETEKDYLKIAEQRIRHIISNEEKMG